MSLEHAITWEQLLQRCLANDHYMRHLLIGDGYAWVPSDWPVGLLNAAWDKAHDNNVPPELGILLHQRIPWPVRCTFN